MESLEPRLLLAAQVQWAVVPPTTEKRFYEPYPVVATYDMPGGTSRIVSAARYSGTGEPSGVTLTILESNATRTDFYPLKTQDLPDYFRPQEIHVADLSGDGIPDLLIVGTGCHILLGNASGGFTWIGQIPGPNGYADSACIADFDHDGDLDIAAQTSAGLVTLKNAGNGINWTSATPGTTATTYLYHLQPCDFDHDGNMDVMGYQWNIYPGKSNVTIGYGDGTGGLSSGRAVTGTDNIQSAVVADVNRDGRPDVVVATGAYDSSTPIVVKSYLGSSGSEPFTDGPSWTGPAQKQVVDLTVADWDNDGVSEVIAAVSDKNSNLKGNQYVDVFRFSANGTPSRSSETLVGTGDYLQALATGYFNKDVGIDTVSVTDGIAKITFNQSSAAAVVPGIGVNTRAAGERAKGNPVPGAIEAEDFDYGVEGVSYHDLYDPAVTYPAPVSRGGGVELVSTPGANNIAIGYFAPGEWVNYTVNVATAGTYLLTVRAANGDASGAASGLNFTSTAGGSANLYVDYTNGYDKFASFSVPITLAAGTQTIKMLRTTGPNCDVDSLTFTPLARTPFPDRNPSPIPGKIEFENYDNGGEGVAYHDTTPNNDQQSYRGDDVDIHDFPNSTRRVVGSVEAGEWLEYTVTIAAAGYYDFTARAGRFGVGATFHVSVDGADVTGPLAVPDVGSSTLADVSKTRIALTAGIHVIRVSFDAKPSGATTLGNFDYFQFTPSPRGPYPGPNAPLMPAQIEAENFDFGDEGTAYHDSTASNIPGAYRATGVDIEQAFAGITDVSYTTPGEWLEYTINVPSAGLYDFDARMALSLISSSDFHVEIDGVNTGSMSVSNTGGWGNFVTIRKSAPLSLTEGRHVLRFVFDATTASFGPNLDWFRLSNYRATYPGPSVPTDTSQVEAENFDEGGEGVAYHDLSAPTVDYPANYRPGTGVELVSTPGANNVAVGYFDVGEWVEYTINVTEAGPHRLTLRAAQGWGAAAVSTLRFSVDGNTLTDIDIPFTGSYGTFQTFTTPGVAGGGYLSLPAGRHVIRMARLSGVPCDVDWFTFAGPTFAYPSPTTPPILGTQKIQAENFDYGGEGNAFHELSEPGIAYPANLRTATGVEIVATPNANAIAVGYFDVGEWLRYTVQPTSGYQKISVRAAVGGAPGDVATLRFTTNGANPQTVDLAVPYTGGWDRFTTVTAVINLAPGAFTSPNGALKLEHLSGAAIDVDWFQFTPTEVVPPTITQATFDYATPGTPLRVKFSENVNNGSMPPGALVISPAAGGPPIGSAYYAYSAADNTATFYLTTPLPDGNYTAHLWAGSAADDAGNLLANDFTFDFFVLTADANHDRSVDFNDLVVLAQNYNTTNKSFTQGDFNYDGTVDFNDLVLLAQRYNTTLAAPTTASPAPALTQAPAPTQAPASLPLSAPAALAVPSKPKKPTTPVFATKPILKPTKKLPAKTARVK